MLSIMEDTSININESDSIKSYLTTNNLLNHLIHKNPVIGLNELIKNTLQNLLSQNNFSPSNAFYINQEINSPEFLMAEMELNDLLTKHNKKCLVIIDSIEKYSIKDPLTHALISSLMQSILDLSNKSNQRVYAKASFPSELFPHILPLNWDKVSNKTHFIHWRYKDLICFLAKRFYKYLSENMDEKELKNLNTFENSRSYLYKFFPETTTTFSNIEFDTISYIIDHTMKKPRQVITITNAILALATQNGVEHTKLNKEIIRDGVHVKLNNLVKGSMDMYNQIFNGAEQIIWRTFANSKNQLTVSALDIQLKEVSSLLKDKNRGIDLSKDEIKRLFLEIGLLGILDHKHDLANNKEILEVLFEYQVKNFLPYNKDSLFILHPMFYQELCIRVYSDSYVHPKAGEDEEREILNEIIKKWKFV